MSFLLLLISDLCVISDFRLMQLMIICFSVSYNKGYSLADARTYCGLFTPSTQLSLWLERLLVSDNELSWHSVYSSSGGTLKALLTR